MVRTTRLAGALLLASIGGLGMARAADTDVMTDQGVVSGLRQGETLAWLGIPYAAPPVGERRLRPPVPPAAWTVPLQADQFGSLCLQARGGVQGSEDCLYLNVWSPARPGGQRPVMVWLHGGAFQVGTSSVPYTSGEQLAAKGDIVVVTLNYRLGAVGYLTAPALDAESPQKVSGNYGLLDQQAALQWVRRNIASFGGDPARIMLAGESAGANSVLYQLTSPAAAGLFGEAVSESPVTNGHAATLASAEAGPAAAVIKAVGCEGAADVAACLRAAPAARLQMAGPANPVVDGVVLPREPIDAFEAGAFNKVPTIIGSNHDEFTVFVAPLAMPPKPALTAKGYAAEVAKTFPGNEAAIAGEYPVADYPSAIQALAVVETDGMVSCPVLRARTALSGFVPTYSYEFSETDPAHGQLLAPPVPGLSYGAYHTAELPYVFGLAAMQGAPVTGKDMVLSDQVIGAWSNFARSGDPNRPGAGLGQWPDHRTAAAVVSLQDVVGVLSDAAFARDHHCGFWGKIRSE